MKITSSVEYATRLMVCLARSGQAMTSERLAQSENVPGDYVNQILMRLRRAGLVESQRGAGGGYSLSRPPARIDLGQVIRAVDGKVFEQVCEKYEGGEKDCHHQGHCSISPVWNRLGQLIEQYLEGVTLDKLVEEGQGSCAKLAWLEKIPLGGDVIS